MSIPAPHPEEAHRAHVSKLMARLIDPEDVFTVLRVDHGGITQLLDPALRQDPRSYGLAFWCLPNQPLEVGQLVQGILEFHPSESVGRGRLPSFTVNVVMPAQP